MHPDDVCLVLLSKLLSRMTITSIYPRAYPGVLYRHAESARSIVVGDEVVITASDDGQIVRHPLPRQVMLHFSWKCGCRVESFVGTELELAPGFVLKLSLV